MATPNAPVTRRAVLQCGMALALAATVPRTPALAQSVVTRRSITTLAADDPLVESYRTAVRAMQALPASDPRNWTRQAQIHNTFCPHRNWYFLPWHRAYLVAFERLCRQLSGNPTFALPYWDWTANPQLPAFFASEMWMGQPNPLFNTTRSSQTVTIPSNVAGPARISTLLAETSFEVFGSSRPPGQNSTAPTWQQVFGIEGPFESGPHDQVHVRISGDMVTFMSPLDPIFWLHYCNIDRLWDEWNRMGRSNASQILWREFAFTGQFVNPSGASETTPFDVNVSSLLDLNTLGYQYVLPFLARAAASPILAQPIDIETMPPVARLDRVPVARVNTVLNMPVRLTASQIQALARVQPITQRQVLDAAQPVQAQGRVVAIIRDVDPPRTGNTEVRVFLNCPYLTPDTSPEDRHYVSSFTFFGVEHAERHGNWTYLIDLTETVMRLRQAQIDVQDEINVQLMPVPLPGVPSASEFTPGSVEVAIF
jgi:tyrosinase